MYRIYLSIVYCLLSIGLCSAQETLTLPETTSIQETPATAVFAETQAVGETTAIEAETASLLELIPSGQVISETLTPQVSLPQLSLVRPGLSLMPTAYVRVSAKHPGETGFNSDFLFNFYIGEIFGYINNQPVFFTPYRIFMFGVDTKYSFTIGQFLKAIGILYEEEYATGRLTDLLNLFDPGSYKQEQKYLPTIAVGLRGWLFRSMGASFDFVEAFEGAQWIFDYYVVASKKIGDYGFHFGYVYGNFINNFFSEIQRVNKLNQGRMGSWNVNEDSHTLFVGFDMNVPWGTKKFMVESIFSSPETFLINTSTGLWGFELGLLKIPNGFTIIGYWNFRSNLFTFF